MTCTNISKQNEKLFQQKHTFDNINNNNNMHNNDNSSLFDSNSNFNSCPSFNVEQKLIEYYSKLGSPLSNADDQRVNLCIHISIS
jgi:hypothetical protein